MMTKAIEFRAWTGKKWYYQNGQYLASFIRRAVSEIIMDTTGEFSSGHESYLPNGGNIEEYLSRFTGVYDMKGRKIFEGDILRYVLPAEHGVDDRPDIYVVEWASFGFEARWLNPPKPSFSSNGHISMIGTDEDMEVIGNIKENADLIPKMV